MRHPGAIKRWRRLTFSLLRLVLALWLVQVLVQDLPAHRARAAYAALPDYNYAQAARKLWAQSRYGESLLVIRAGLAQATPEQKRRLLALRGRIESDQHSLRHRLRELGRGALYGRGNTPMALAGAILADMFVFGDVRDLVIQGDRAMRGKKPDKVLVALSALGILLTFTPEEVGVDMLKALRRSRALTTGMVDSLARMARRALDRDDYGALRKVAGETAHLSEEVGPAAGMRIMKGIDSPAELARASAFARQYPEGGFALWLYGRPAVKWLDRGGAQDEKALLMASRKGRPGLRWLRRYGMRALRPHPLIGLVKGVYKGNIPKLLIRLLERYDLVILGLGAAWALLELVLLPRRVGSVMPRA